MKTLISLFDYTGNWSRPYKEAGWNVIQVDIQHGIDVMIFPYKDYGCDGLLISEPCTDYATSGAKHFKAKDSNGRTESSQSLVSRTKEIIDYYNPFFWSLENPRTRIHKLNPWIGQRPKFIFNPCDFAQFDPEYSRYNKETRLFGKFNDPVICRMEPLQKNNPGWEKLGGNSLATKNARSITPMGFAKAFYNANH